MGGSLHPIHSKAAPSSLKILQHQYKKEETLPQISLPTFSANLTHHNIVKFMNYILHKTIVFYSSVITIYNKLCPQMSHLLNKYITKAILFFIDINLIINL